MSVDKVKCWDWMSRTEMPEIKPIQTSTRSIALGVWSWTFWLVHQSCPVLISDLFNDFTWLLKFECIVNLYGYTRAEYNYSAFLACDI